MEQLLIKRNRNSKQMKWTFERREDIAKAAFASDNDRVISRIFRLPLHLDQAKEISISFS
jgi:hypothetical protein